MSSRVIHRGQGTDMEVSADSRPHPSTVPALLGAAHPGPALAVTVLAALLGTALDLTPDRVVLVTAAVFCGQLSIGWSNDLVDLARDRAVGRRDKPLAARDGQPADRDRGLCRRRGACASCSRSRAAGPPGSCTSAAPRPAGPTTSASRRRSGRGRRTPRRSAGCPSSCGWPVTTPDCRRRGCPSRRPAWAWAPTCSTCCPTSTTTEPRECAGLPHRLGARRLPAAAVVVLGAGSALVLLGADVATWAAVAGLVVVAALAVVVLHGPRPRPVRGGGRDRPDRRGAAGGEPVR